MSEFGKDLMSEFEKNVACVMDSVFGSLRKTELDYIDEVIKEKDLYKNVVEKIKKVINNQVDYREFVDIVNAIEEILDKTGDINEKKN